MLPLIAGLAAAGIGGVLRNLSNKQMPIVDPREYGQSAAGYYGHEAYERAREKFGSIAPSIADRSAASTIRERARSLPGLALGGAQSAQQQSQLQGREVLRTMRGAVGESPAARAAIASRVQSGLAANAIANQAAQTANILQANTQSAALEGEAANVLREGRRQSLAEAMPYAVQTDAAGLGARMQSEMYNAENDNNALRGLAEGVGVGLQTVGGMYLQGGPDFSSISGAAQPIQSGAISGEGINSQPVPEGMGAIARGALGAAGAISPAVGAIGRTAIGSVQGAGLPTLLPGPEYRFPNLIQPQKIEAMILPEPATLSGEADVMFGGKPYRRLRMNAGDTLWDIADRELGSSLLWRSILDGGGNQFGYGRTNNVYRIPVGTEIYLPR